MSDRIFNLLVQVETAIVTRKVSINIHPSTAETLGREHKGQMGVTSIYSHPRLSLLRTVAATVTAMHDFHPGSIRRWTTALSSRWIGMTISALAEQIPVLGSIRMHSPGGPLVPCCGTPATPHSPTMQWCGLRYRTVKVSSK